MMAPAKPTPNAAMASMIAATALTSPTAEFACERSLGAFQQEPVSITCNVATVRKIAQMLQTNKTARNPNATKRSLSAMIWIALDLLRVATDEVTALTAQTRPGARVIIDQKVYHTPKVLNAKTSVVWLLSSIKSNLNRRVVNQSVMYLGRVGKKKLFPISSDCVLFPARCDPLTQFTCNSGRCIDIRQKCDGVGDCADYTDELQCPTSNSTNESKQTF